MDELHSHTAIKKVIAEKKGNEGKYKKPFDAFVITNGKGFEKNAEKFAKYNDVKLISRNNLIEFISQIDISPK